MLLLFLLLYRGDRDSTLPCWGCSSYFLKVEDHGFLLCMRNFSCLHYVLCMYVCPSVLTLAGGGGGDSYIKKVGCSSFLLGVKNMGLVSLSVFSLKCSTVGAFAAPFRILS